MFRPIKKTTATELVIEKIAEYITSGKLAPGERLLNERDLAEQFGVTRGRIREALRALSIIGLVTIKPGEGSFVTKKNEPVRTDTILYLFHSEKNRIEEVYAARKLIEGEVFRTAAPKLGAKDFQFLSEKIDELRKVPQDDLEEFQRLTNEFDLFLGEKCGNLIYYKLLQTMVVLRQETSLKLLTVPGAKENSLRCRMSILDAMICGDEKQLINALNHIYESAKMYY